ncbi:MAG: mechanosensitive ion channel [Bacteroidia bacterium]|nr:mechanosensitive ion channel [Bacteroidia bacterium]NNF31341.1 mechanosensitive ion channel [Flavobacteriaceae bacterium]MBT8276583.1 mechanosensitive ion channel [Bacteroidia bacterium]NNJ82552.1 mechanosensitive ion channel [Flavobacteriaceae bacterium]NNK54385.1 mechanosensitive ion channel [Flavobacteriaceae bacterium]
MKEYVPELLQSAIIILFHVIVRWILVRIIRRFAKRSEKVEHRTGLIVKYINLAIIFLIIFGLILIWGVEFTDVGWVMSSVFAVIGIGFFAQWSILSNITSGIIMFFTFPYKIGDFIIIHDKEYDFEGTIDDIKGFHIVIKTKSGEIITYPNSLMLQKGVTVIKPDDIDNFLNEEDKNVKEHPID